MSKIVDLLTYKKRAAGKKGYEELFPPKIITENFDTKTREHLANTYIISPLNKSAGIKNEESIFPNRKTPSNNHKLLQLFPWLISLLAIVLLLINIAYRGKVNIKIEFLGAESGKTASGNMGERAIENPQAQPGGSVSRLYAANSFIFNGETNTHIIKRVGFYGAALRDSKMLKDGVCLINDGTAGWASAGFDLAVPSDLTASSLDFFAKGASGRESLKLILRDADNNSYIPQAQNLIFNKNMGRDWQFVSIPFSKFSGYYNPKRISHIGFEFGTQTTSNDPGSCIYIKNIQIVSK